MARRFSDLRISIPVVGLSNDRRIYTQMAFGKILDNVSKGDSELATRILTTSPDVAGTTNLGPSVTTRCWAKINVPQSNA